MPVLQNMASFTISYEQTLFMKTEYWMNNAEALVFFLFFHQLTDYTLVSLCKLKEKRFY